jgi:hypothetical protein
MNDIISGERINKHGIDQVLLQFSRLTFSQNRIIQKTIRKSVKIYKCAYILAEMHPQVCEKEWRQVHIKVKLRFLDLFLLEQVNYEHD